MEKSASEPHVIGSFTDKQWTGKLGSEVFWILFGSGVVGFLVSLIMMIFVPSLRDFGAVALFTALFAISFTAILVAARSSSEQAFLRKFTSAVNETIADLSGSAKDQLSVELSRNMIEGGGRLPISVNGVPGLEIEAVRGQDVNRGDRPSARTYTSNVLRQVGDLGRKRDYYSLIELGGSLSFLVSEISRIVLRPVLGELVTRYDDSFVITTHFVITVSGPDYGITSFDRLLTGALDDPERQHQD